MKGRRVKKSFLEVVTSGRGGKQKKRVNEGEYGRCILYSYMKIEE
jgi:hypothetical protein